jgi:Putative beta-barrel porin 2
MAIPIVTADRIRTAAGFAAGILTAAGAGAYDFAQPPPGLPPDAVNTFQLYVADQETYDDNLFRLPPGTVGVPGAVFANPSKSDAVNTATFGGQGKWDIGRQDFEINLRADENRFARNDGLNYVSSNAVGYWNWRVGQYFSGQVATFYDRSLASFGETRYSGKDLVTSLEELGSARYQIGPHWAAYGQIRGSYTDHSAEVEQFNDFHNKAGIAGIEYATNVNDTFGFEYQYVDITFNQSVAVAAGAYDYNEDTGRFLVKYAFTDKTSIDAYAGYLERKYPGLDIGSYSGDIWRANFLWTATEKTQLGVSVWHELHAYVDAESNYFVAKGASLAPTWIATEKLSFTLLGSYEKQNYIGSSSSVVVGGAREDKVDSQQATIRYVPRDAWIVNVFFRHEKRESNQYQFTYDDNLVSANVTYRFW